MTSKFFLVALILFSSSLFCQNEPKTDSRKSSNFSINTESSTAFNEGPSSFLLGAEYQYFQNQKGNIKANARAGFGYFRMKIVISELSGICGYVGSNLLLGTTHHLETNLCLLVGNDTNQESFFFFHSNDGTTDTDSESFAWPFFTLGYKYESTNGFIARTGLGTTGIYIGLGVNL